jgi:methanogenic corrinoid protein MtbC1
MLTIGALARASGVTVETLRTWERRYGHPVATRTPSGQRVYPPAAVPQLRRVVEALARGHRAREVLTASADDLAALLEATPAGVARPPATRVAPADAGELLDAVRAFDGERVTRTLAVDWGRLGPLRFLRERVAPLVRAVGDGWAAGTLEVRHEHFFSERLGDLLRTLRLPFDERATGPIVVLATLPGEAHTLGLQMAALVLATAGGRLAYLGAQTPPTELVAVANDLRARAVGVSVSVATRGAATTSRLRRLRAALPRHLDLVVGGEGAPAPRRGITVLRDLADLDAWARRALGS